MKESRCRLGAVVTVIADDGEVAFDVFPYEEAELLEAIAEVERGQTVTAAELLDRLRR